jgi:hypothetical protein
MTGYAHPGYVESLAELGVPRELPRCGGWVLERQIPGFPDHDAMGCYPLFCCQDWSQLDADLKDLGDELVSLALVTDPFGEYSPACLRRCFQGVVIPFKDHFIADLCCPTNDIVSAHHRQYARKALKSLHVEECQNPIQFIDEWVDLYTQLVDRHDIKGIKAFSRRAFAKQLTIPGTAMFRALHDDVIVGMHIWFLQGEVGYGHLGAYSEAGYELGAAYALYRSVIERLSDKVRWLDLGAGAGTRNDGDDGLSRFKRGWSTGTRTAYFCGQVFDRQKYAEIVKAKGVIETDYFPAYRKGEFQ